MSEGPEPVEGYIRQTFGLDAEGLQRVALLLLAHVLIDTRLIARGLFKTIDERSGGKGLPPDGVETAERLNEARNALLHWNRTRFSLPVYKGQDATTEAGFRACMD